MSKLPDQFADLEAKWARWIIDNDPARARLRLDESQEELDAFYEDVKPRVEEIIKYLDPFPLDGLPQDATNLWWLLSSYIGVAVALEVYGSVHRIPGADLVPSIRFYKTENALNLLT